MLDRVAVSAEDNTLRGFFLNGLHARSTGDKVSDIGFFITVVMMEMQRSVVVKTTARAT